jgi:hypothetical protein
MFSFKTKKDAFALAAVLALAFGAWWLTSATGFLPR